MGGDHKANFLPEEMWISVCLAGKWKSRRIENCENRKVGDIKYFNFLSYVFSWGNGKVERFKILLFGWKIKWEDKKLCFYKFTLLPLLHKKNYKKNNLLQKEK